MLCTVARVMDLVMRDVDVKGRVGGDEFALVLPDTDADAASRAIDRLAAALGAAAVKCSVGTVVFLSPPPDVAEAIAAVDAVMYEVKADPTLNTAVRIIRSSAEDKPQVSIASS